MKTYKKLIVISNLIIFFFLLTGDLFPQYDNWGAKQEYSFTLKTWNSNSRTFHYDVASDNYGLHFVGLNSNTTNHNLTYYLLDNNGQILEQFENSEYSYYGVSILSSKGNVVIAAVSQSGIVIFKKSNGVSTGFVKIGVYSGGNYSFATSYYMKNMSSAEFNNKIYISWDYAGFSNFPDQGNIGLLQYDASNNEIMFRDPIDRHLYSESGTGFSPKLTASSSKLHAVYRISTSEQYIQEPFMSRDMYYDNNNLWKLDDPMTLGTWDGEHYYYDPETRVDILCVGDNLYAVGHLFYYGSGGLTIDTKFKRKLITATEWQELRDISIGEFNIYKTPPMIYDQYTNKLVFSFSNDQGSSYMGYNREFDIVNSTLENQYSVFTDSYLLGGSLSTSNHGNYLVFSQQENLGKYDVSRRIRPISGNITYNTLLTGTDYINSSISTVCHSNGAKIIAQSGSVTTIASNSQLYIDQNDLLELKSGSTLNILDNAQLIIDGSYTSLKFNPNVSINLGTNAKIIVRNGALLDANGATFTGINGTTWQGIEFDRSNNQIIRYCNFSNALTSLKFLYDPRNEVVAPNIQDNIFNVAPLNSSYGIYSEDMNFATIGNNTFNMSGSNSIGIYMKTSKGSTSSSETTIYYKLQLFANKFNGGFAGMYLDSYASDLKPYFLYGNYFNVNSSNVGNFGIVGKKIICEIKNCVFSATKTNIDIATVQSSLRFTNNNLGAIDYNISAYTNSTINIAPSVTTSEIILTGGYNSFYSSSSDNIFLRTYQDLYINNGYNCFSGHGSGKLHLDGYLNIGGTTYDAYNNYWNTQAPDYLLFNNTQPPQPITLNWSQSALCKRLALSVDQIIDRGNGLYDTIFKSQNSTNVVIQPDESLYNQAYSYLSNSNFPTAILNFKTLIDDYPSSMFLSGTLYDLYSSYESLDTSSNQNYKDNLYSDLKTYLTTKINSNSYDEQFNDIAYNMVLMCETNLKNYNDALTGYQFIATYNPDAIARLMASWDFVEVEDLINGMSGGVNENISNEKYVLDLTKRLESHISKDSTMKKLKHQYAKESELNNSKLNIELGSKNIVSRNKAIEKKSKDELLIRKSVDVLMSSKSLTKEQKTKRQIEDMILITKNDHNNISNENNNQMPTEYNLSQNYPNPFNPTTKINYALPKTGLVTLKIYDVTGREIQTLVNDVKQAGNYTVDFNGANLSSGVYFYKIQSGDFVSVKRMVLIK